MFKTVKFNRNIINDFALNILASILLTFTTQLIAFPYISSITTIEQYGLVLLIMGLVNIIGVSMGNSLNNSRLLMQKKNDSKNLNGDYNIIFVFLVIIVTLISSVIAVFFYREINLTVIGIVLTSVLLLFRAYYIVDFRINLNYKKNLLVSLYAVIGCLLGIAIAKMTGIWIAIFLFSELFAFIYLLFSVSIIKDKFSISPLFNNSLNNYFYLFLAGMISAIMMYIDRLIIYPFLDPQSVSIFTVASFLGKTAGIVIGPIAGVLLSYYAREINLTLNIFYKRITFYMIGTILIMIVIITFGEFFIEMLYPSIAPFVSQYFIVANLGAVIFILGNLIQPILLSYCHEKWNLILQIIYFILYGIICTLCLLNFGLMGFCYAVIFVNSLRVMFMIYSIRYFIIFNTKISLINRNARLNSTS
ncbi:hypothetical protein [Sutcliffiella horikoshii]|uniref:hypothetical protein n=1 Tax=Sutcliffiella horikoshii TaxID=79883 RepID=UPI001F184551|nr:hypothetical protein [Sutcliffiella horikoshii]MCG1021405.1 hypothetical protein [Sutcliffiella horikoshii]